MPWKRIYRNFAELYYWTPDQVNRLTMYQMKVYLSAKENLSHTKKMTKDELIAFQARKAKERAAKGL